MSATQPPSRHLSGDVIRTKLAIERTYLAWWRSGLAAFVASFAVGKLFPDVVGGTRWPYTLSGLILAVLGIMLIAYGIARYRVMEKAVEHGEFADPDRRLLVFIGLGGAVAGLAVTVVVALGA